VLDRGWTLRFDGYGAGSVPIAKSLGVVEPGDWRVIPALSQASGTGRYRTSFDGRIARAARRRRLLLDLGQVGDVARVTLNGCVATLPVAPFVVDVSAALRRGRNDLQVEVANTFNNALAGGTTDGFTYYGASAPAGLIGPVTVAVSGRGDAGLTRIQCNNTRR
jgi:hypothetical protein